MLFPFHPAFGCVSPACVRIKMVLGWGSQSLSENSFHVQKTSRQRQRPIQLVYVCFYIYLFPFLYLFPFVWSCLLFLLVAAGMPVDCFSKLKLSPEQTSGSDPRSCSIAISTASCLHIFYGQCPVFATIIPRVIWLDSILSILALVTSFSLRIFAGSCAWTWTGSSNWAELLRWGGLLPPRFKD